RLRARKTQRHRAREHDRARAATRWSAFGRVRPRPRHVRDGVGPGRNGGGVNRPRVLLADDHRIVAEGLRRLLEPEFDLVEVAEDGVALLAAAERHKPDVIVADIGMPTLNGIDALMELRKTQPEARVVFLTMHRDPAYLERARAAGALGFVLKHSAA